uniref:HAD family hydrolase n=1 Tax=Thermofilum pendens TaxID=2269 RepID=A0A7J3X820_THEPE
MGSRVRFVSLDLDGTVVSREYVDYFWLELVPRLYAERWRVGLEEAKRLVFSAYDEVGPGDIRWYRPAYWFERFGFPELLGWALEEAGRLVRLYDDAVSFLEAARGRVEVVISTSASREFISLVLERAPILREYVSAVFSSSSDFSLPGKPPEFFRAVLARLGAQPDEVVHVGDDAVHDYENPRSVGVRAFLVSREEGRGDPPEKLRSLLELLKIIQP